MEHGQSALDEGGVRLRRDHFRGRLADRLPGEWGRRFDRTVGGGVQGAGTCPCAGRAGKGAASTFGRTALCARWEEAGGAAGGEAVGGYDLRRLESSSSRLSPSELYRPTSSSAFAASSGFS